MATITRKGDAIETLGELPELGKPAPAFTLAAKDLSDLTLQSLSGKTVILNIFPSIDTPTCATSVRAFNAKAAELENTIVLCISADLPFAMSRFCGAEGIESVQVGSTFRSSFGLDYGVTITTGALSGLLSRAIVIVDPEGTVKYTEQVPEISQEPDYEKALAAI